MEELAMNKETITSIMLKEHTEIFRLLGEYEKNRKNKDSAIYFEKLNKKQENHVYMEEKAIFMLYQERKRFPEIIILLRQHEELKKILEKLREEKSIEK